MKKSALLFGLLLLVANLVAQKQTQTAPPEGPSIAFNKEVHNFDTIYTTNIPEGKVRFEVYNKGTEPLLMLSVTACCGTTVNGHTKEPIAVNDTGYVEVHFLIPPAPHRINRKVTIISNDTRRQVSTLHITGIVMYPKDDGILREEE